MVLSCVVVVVQPIRLCYFILIFLSAVNDGSNTDEMANGVGWMHTPNGDVNKQLVSPTQQGRFERPPIPVVLLDVSPSDTFDDSPTTTPGKGLSRSTPNLNKTWAAGLSLTMPRSYRSKLNTRDKKHKGENKRDA